MPIKLTDFIIRKPRVPSINLPSTLPPTSSGTYAVTKAFTVKYTGAGTTALMHVTAKNLTTLVNGDRNHVDCLNLSIASKTLAEVQAMFSTLTNYTFVLQGVGTDRAYLEGLLSVDVKTASVQVNYGIPAEYLVEAENTAKFGTATVRWVKNKFNYNSQESTWLINTGASYDVTGELVPLGANAVTGTVSITTKTFYDGTGANAANNIFKFTANGDENTVTFAASGAGTSTTLAAIITQINAQAPNVPVYASASGSFVLLSSFSAISVQDGSANSVLGFSVLPPPGEVVIENGVHLDLTPNPANPSFDLAKQKTVVDQVLINSASDGTEFVTMPVLEFIVPGTLQVKYNSVLKTEFVDYISSAQNKRLNFLRNITGESHTLVDPVLNYISVNTLGISGILTDYVNVNRNGNPLVPNIDFIAQSTSAYQGVNVGNGVVFFTTTYTDDPLADYVLTTEPVLFNDDLTVKKNGVAIDSSEFIAVLEAGFINLNQNLFPGDTLTATYRSTKYGQITDEILAGNPAVVQNTSSGPFHIISGVNDILNVAGDGNPAETITLPIGTGLTLDAIIAAYNSQAVNTFMTTNSTSTLLVISSRTPGTASTVSVLAGSGNSVLGFVAASTVGSGGVGGEFAFDLKNAPIELTSFNAPELGNTFFIKEHDVAANYPSGTLIQLNGDLYTVNSSSVVNRAVIYNFPPSAAVVSSSSPDPYVPPHYLPVTYRISTDVNDKFTLTVDGITYIITLTPSATYDGSDFPFNNSDYVSGGVADRTSAQIVADIALHVPSGVASVETFNGIDYIKIQSSVGGVGGSVLVGPTAWVYTKNYAINSIVEFKGNVYTSLVNGNLKKTPDTNPSLWKLLDTSANLTSANLMLGFQYQQKDTGLPDTKIVINGAFTQTYINPILKSTHKAVVYLTEPTSPEKSASGTNSISFNGVDLTQKFKKRVSIRINNEIYFVVKSQFISNTTVVYLTRQIQNPLYSTDVVEYTNRPIYLEGDTQLRTTYPPYLDSTHTIVVKNNGVALPINGYEINSDGSITLSAANALSSSSNITAAYTSVTDFDPGDVVTIDYRIFFSVLTGTQVTASYEYISADKFFLDVVYQNNLAGTIYDTIQNELSRIENPSSSGFSSTTGGSLANEAGGNETPDLGEFKYRYLDDIAKSIFEFYDNRIKNFTDERKYYNGMIPGGDDGNVTETNMQDCVNPTSRMFPTGYTKINPLRVPALDTINKKDDGSGDGGTDLSVAIPNLLATELADVTAENALLTTLLGISTGGGVSVLGTASITTVTFYDGTVILNPANNVFLFTVDGTPITVTLTASGAGVSTTLASIIAQIGIHASQSGSQILLSATNSVTVQAGSANTDLGFTAGGGAANRSGSVEYAQWLALINEEIAKNTAVIASKNAVLAASADVLEEYVGVYVKAFDETKINQAFLAGTFTTELQNALTKNNIDVGMNINNDLNITNRRDITNPPRIAEINNEIPVINARLLQVENYLLGNFSQAVAGAAIFTGNFAATLVFDGANTVDDVVTPWNVSNPSNTISFSGVDGTDVLPAQTVNLVAAEGEALLDNRYAWVAYRTNRSNGTIQSIKRVLDGRTNNDEQVNIDNSLLNAIT